jgi:hypothetical protein
VGRLHATVPTSARTRANSYRSRIRGKWATGISLVIALALLVPSAHGQTTHPAYVNEVNAICKQTAHEGKDRLDKLRPTGNRVLDLIRRSATYAKLLGIAARRIEAVEPPPEDRPAVEAWVAGIRHEKRLIERFVRAVKHRQANRARKLSIRSLRVRGKSQARAAQLGLTACSGPANS